MLLEDYDPLKGDMLQVLDAEGNVDNALEPKLDDEILIKIYETMILTRSADERAVNLQRQGKMGTYPPSQGQEASQIGPSSALREQDWLVTGFRELGALLWKGVPLWKPYLFWMGNEIGGQYTKEFHVTPPVVPVGDQIPHAVGVSYASKIKKTDEATMVFFGEGGSSEGSFNEGLNLAGVLKTPIVFVCQNNQYAISLPASRQTSSKTIAQKAVAYGFPGILVDGNDALALHIAADEALERARSGEGPTLIEAYTYRMGDHTTSDDATRYRTEQEIEAWKKKDPINRFRVYLENKGLLDSEKEERYGNNAKEAVNEAVNKALTHPDPSIEDTFKYMYEQMPSYLNEELDRLRKDLDEEGF